MLNIEINLYLFIYNFSKIKSYYLNLIIKIKHNFFYNYIRLM